jgi:D-inositol-3-phosphate glycosyltransferase
MRERPDVIHTSGAEAGFAMALLRSEGIRIPWVHTNYATLTVRRVVVDGVEPREALADPYAQREQLCLTGCDAVVALSETDKVETVKVFGLAGSKVTAVTPGIDTDIFKPDKMQPAGHLVVSAGRMSPIKDFPFLLRAFRHTSSMLNHQSQLIIIGGNQEERVVLGLPAIVKELGLSSQVKFLDGMPQAELARWFRKARVYAGCSRHETFGLLPVEARACGAPFVVRANSAYLDTCEDGFGGSFVDNTDEKEMGKRFAEILSLREREWRSLSEQAVESAKPFSWETAVAKNLLVYQQVLEGGMVRF